MGMEPTAPEDSSVRSVEFRLLITDRNVMTLKMVEKGFIVLIKKLKILPSTRYNKRSSVPTFRYRSNLGGDYLTPESSYFP